MFNLNFQENEHVRAAAETEQQNVYERLFTEKSLVLNCMSLALAGEKKRKSKCKKKTNLSLNQFEHFPK